MDPRLRGDDVAHGFPLPVFTGTGFEGMTDFVGALLSDITHNTRRF
jgi:hypothetical protein